jgi:hypothetical protein
MVRYDVHRRCDRFLGVGRVERRIVFRMSHRLLDRWAGRA